MALPAFLGHPASGVCLDSVCCFASNGQAIAAALAAVVLLTTVALFLAPEAVSLALLRGLFGLTAVGVGRLSTAGMAVSVERVIQVLTDSGLSLEKATDYAASFRGQIIERIAQTGEEWNRFTDFIDSSGSFITKGVFSSSNEAATSLDIARFNNYATYMQKVICSSPTTVFEGSIDGGAEDVIQTLVTKISGFSFDVGKIL